MLFSRLGGVQNQIQGEGMHVRVPWLQWPLIYDIRSRAYKVVSPSGTADLQMVDIGLRVLYRPNPGKIPEMAQQIGEDFSDKILPSIIHETLKSVIAEFSAQSLLTEREKVKKFFFFIFMRIFRFQFEFETIWKSAPVIFILFLTTLLLLTPSLVLFSHK